MGRPVIRPAGPPDIAAISRLLVQLYALEVPGICPGRWVAEWSSLDALRGVLTIGRGPVPDEALIHSVVEEGMRRERLGERLLDRLEAEGRWRGKRRVVLQVLQDNAPARRFYAARGYVERPVRPALPRRMLAHPSVLMEKSFKPA